MEQFGERLLRATRRAGTSAIVGVDPFLDRLPGPLRHRSAPDAIEAFSLGVVDAVADLVPAIKPQLALFEAQGSGGYRALERVCAAARARGLLVILDGKRGDIGSTAEAYAHAQLDDDGPLAGDAATVSPYLGPESLAPYLARTQRGKGVFVLVRTSNPGAHTWQGAGPDGLAGAIAAWIRTYDQAPFSDVGAVIGATLPEGVAPWRAALPHTWLLVPGFGAQGAGVDQVRPAFTPDGGALIVSAREVLYPAAGHDGADWVDQIRRRAHAFRERLACLP